jgi:hypothetical protein
MPDEVARDLIDGALELADAARRASIRYALIGGLAVGYRTRSRFTRDIDFLLQIPQLALPSLLDELSHREFEFDPPTAIREWTQHHMTVLTFRGARVDWLKPVIAAYQHVLEGATDETWLGRPIRIATAEGLVLTKLLSNRTHDWVDIENLVAAHHGTLDLEWIRAEWQAVSSLNDPQILRLTELAAAQK